MLSALRGAVRRLTRFPAGTDADWDAVRTTPVVLPVVGVVIGLLAGVTLLVPAPLATPPALYLGTLYLVTGTGHLRGLASLTDQTGTGHDAGLVVVVIVVVALALGAFSLVGTGGGGLGGLTGASITLSLVVASEVAAKAGLATLLARGSVGEGGADVTGLLPVAVVLVAVVAVVPAVARPAVVAALVTGVLVAVVVGGWTRRHRRTGAATPADALGAADELGRVVAVHVGVIVWTVA